MLDNLRAVNSLNGGSGDQNALLWMILETNVANTISCWHFNCCLLNNDERRKASRPGGGKERKDPSDSRDKLVGCGPGRERFREFACPAHVHVA